MRIVLDESSDASQSSKGAARLISVNDTEFSHADRKFLVTAVFGIKYEAVTRTVHGFERPFLLFNVQCEHVVFVILPVARLLPEFAMQHVRRDNSGRLSMTMERVGRID